MDLNRRSFLGGLLGLAATPLIKLDLKPKRSLFFFGESYRPNFSFGELHKAIARQAYQSRYIRPIAIKVSKEQYKVLWDRLGEIYDPYEKVIYSQRFSNPDLCFENLYFNGIPTSCDEIVKDELYGIKDIVVRADVLLDRPG